MSTNMKPRNWRPNVRTTYQATLPLLVATCLSLNLHAQALDAIPLFNWAAPLYWQPSETEDKVVHDTRSATTPVGALVFVGMTPCRLVDTRSSSNPPFTGGFGPPILAGQATRTFPIQSSTNCSVPSIAQAYSFNVTVVPPGFLGFITVFPTGQPKPVASTLNSLQGFIVANAAVVPAGTIGSVDVFANNPTELIIDINGYYAPPTGLTLATGTAAAPSLSFSGAAGTGIFSSGAGALNIATGGTSRLTVRADGDLDMAGNIRKGGSLFLHNLGTQNTAVGLTALSSNTTGGVNTATGDNALLSNTTGSNNTATGGLALVGNTTGANNTAFGAGALFGNMTGNRNTATGEAALFNNTGSNNTATGQGALQNNTAGSNTATGFGALFGNTTGTNNTAAGASALISNTTGSDNTATGFQALSSNTTGIKNTATGVFALFPNTIGENNTATGFGALGSNTTGTNNTATGALALNRNTTGVSNTATGFQALISNTTGSNNNATGDSALSFNTTGNQNTATGLLALGSNTTGSGNIALGTRAGLSITTGSNNIMIGNPGFSTDDFVIRIGDSQTRAFIAGIRGVTTGAGAIPVVIDSNGQLGTASSSRRVKRDIHDMGDTTAAVMNLRPVRFRYTAHGPEAPVQYGLVAEEVAEVAPELVVRNKDGEIETVFYDKVNTMLLNEVQKQHRQIQQLESRLAAIEAASQIRDQSGNPAR